MHLNGPAWQRFPTETGLAAELASGALEGSGNRRIRAPKARHGACLSCPVFLRIRLQAVFPVRIRNLAAQDFMSSLDS